MFELICDIEQVCAGCQYQDIEAECSICPAINTNICEDLWPEMRSEREAAFEVASWDEPRKIYEAEKKYWATDIPF